MRTEQIKFWESDFGADYTDRNTQDRDAFENDHIICYGVTKAEMNKEFLDGLSRDIKILEVGCNTGMQLLALQRMGFKNLYGIELQSYAVEKAKEICIGIDIRQSSGFEIPFKDKTFDLVYTHGVLIHIHPGDLEKMMREMVRVSSRYIWGFEYHDTELKEMPYRGNNGFLWKADYCEIFKNSFPELKLLKKNIYPYINEGYIGNQDCMYLLSK